jgi:hypothetical protein
MRVRISYAVDLDSIPDLIQREFGNTLPELINTAEKLQASTELLNLIEEAPEVSPELCKRLINDLLELREVMAKTEQILVDFVPIINGFEGALSGPVGPNNLSQPPTPPTENVDE